MGKMVKFQIVDAAGRGAAGQKVVAGDVELTTTGTGFVQALLDDGATVVKVNGVEVYRGPVDALRPVEVITTSGQRQA